MPDRLPLLRVDHVSIAVREMGPALAFFRRVLPIRMREAPRPGYDGQFTWADFFVGDRKLELIESARPESFVEQFIARRGEGFHHLSLDVEEHRLDGHVALLEREGLRIVDRGDYGNGDKTAFISPRTTPGILVQFWQVPGFRGAPPGDVPTDPVATQAGVRFRVDHLAIDVDRLDVLAERLAADGVKLVAGAEIPGGRKTAFIHPRDAHGVLIQFWQEPAFGGPRRR